MQFDPRYVNHSCFIGNYSRKFAFYSFTKLFNASKCENVPTHIAAKTKNPTKRVCVRRINIEWLKLFMYLYWTHTNTSDGLMCILIWRCGEYYYYPIVEKFGWKEFDVLLFFLLSFFFFDFLYYTNYYEYYYYLVSSLLGFSSTFKLARYIFAVRCREAN